MPDPEVYSKGLNTWIYCHYCECMSDLTPNGTLDDVHGQPRYYLFRCRCGGVIEIPWYPTSD